jgi:hypothetical protein
MPGSCVHFMAIPPASSPMSRGLRNALAPGTPSICSRSPSHHFEHVEHGAEQRRGEAACRDPLSRGLDPGRLATGLFVHLKPPAPSTRVTNALDEKVVALAVSRTEMVCRNVYRLSKLGFAIATCVPLALDNMYQRLIWITVIPSQSSMTFLVLGIKPLRR